MVGSLPGLAEIRAQFPSLGSGFGFFDHAGGSQVPGVVIDEISRFYREEYAQKGATYRASLEATRLHDECKLFMNRLFGGEATGSVAVGPSATALFGMLAGVYSRELSAGDEIVISVANHESNIGCWERLQEFGVVVKWWGVDPMTGLSSVYDLESVVTPRTKMIIFPMTCNLYGDVLDVQGVASIAKRIGAVTVVDAVAAAAHQVLAVEEWGIDFCAVSCYKIYGPHMAAMWGRNELWSRLTGPNHRQLTGGVVRFELGCLSYESMAGFLALGRYLGFLVGEPVEPGVAASRSVIERAFERMEKLEDPIEEAMLGWLNSRDDLRVLGVTSAGQERHPTFSIVHRSMASDEIERRVNLEGSCGVKGGHFYAWRACEAVGIAPEPGVVRVSAVHTNTVDEVMRVCGILERALG